MVQFSFLRDLARKELTEYLDQYAGTKALVWDEALTGPLDLIANYQFLREREVVKMFPLKPGRLPPLLGAKNVVFVTRPETGLMDAIAENVKGEEGAKNQERSEFHILFVPSRSLLCDRRLKDKGVFGSFTFLDELSIYWFPLESDVISMETSSIYRNFHLDKDHTCLHPIAKAMMSLQALYGVFPNVYGKGKCAKQVFDFMSRMRKEMLGEEPQVTPQIDTLIILDRQIDLISPLVTQLTYEGLIDEMFGIHHNCVKLPADRFIVGEGQSDQGSSSASDVKQVSLSSSEEMFGELRDKNFNAVGPALSRKAKAVSAQYDERHGAKTVKELKLFVDKIPQMQIMKQSLATHTCIAEMIKEQTDQRRFLEALQVEQELLNYHNTDRAMTYVEDAACQNEEFLRVLRIVCLQAVVNSGLKPKVLEGYRRLLLQSYGYRHLLSLDNLDRLGLLSPQLSTRNYAVLRKRLNLTLDDVDEQKPADIAYVHSVYAPLSVRLVQHFTSPGWKAIRDVLDMMPGPTLEEVQALPAGLRRQQRHNNQQLQEPDERRKTTLVLFVGGCTYAEISALRFLSQMEDSTVDYLVATTAIINGKSFLKSLMSEVNDSLQF